MTEPAYKSAGRAINYALVVGTGQAWAQASLVMLRLSREERVALAFAALSTLEPSEIYQVGELAITGEVE